MTRVVRNAVLACVAGILAASAALASVPDPSHCTFTNLDPSGGALAPGFIAVEGASLAGRPDSCGGPQARCGAYQIIVRDFTNTPIAGSSVIMDFSGCSDIQISCDQLTAVTGQTNLAGKKVQALTNASGIVVFQVQGASNSTTHQLPAPAVISPGTAGGTPCAQVFADGVPLTNLIVSAYDVNGLGSPSNAAVSGADTPIVVNENLFKASLGTRARSDYNYNGVTDGADQSIMVAMVLNAATTGSVKTTPFADNHFCP